MQYSNVLATHFFTNKDQDNCPVINCTLKQPNCKDDYWDDVVIDNKDPFGIFIVANYPDGWIDPACLICENQNEVVAVEIVID